MAKLAGRCRWAKLHNAKVLHKNISKAKVKFLVNVNSQNSKIYFDKLMVADHSAWNDTPYYFTDFHGSLYTNCALNTVTSLMNQL